MSYNKIISYPINQNENDMMRWIEDRKNYERQIKENIDYDIILEQYDKKWLDEIVMLMVDIVCCNEPYIRINKGSIINVVVNNKKSFQKN